MGFEKDLKMCRNTELDHQQDHVNDRWRSVPFLHPSKFDSIAMESDLKSKVRSDLDYSDVKTLLMQTTSKSVVVIEDLDQFLMDKSTGVSLSGVLNFLDGILNCCCAKGRIMVFTMNSKDHVDRGILRPGRIDVHIHFPLCDGGRGR